MTHPLRTGLAAAAGAALCLPLLATLPLASAHEGHGDAPAPPPSRQFQKVTLNDRPGEPVDLAVLPDGDVLHTTRAGVIWHNDAETGVNSIAGRIPVYLHDEEGLQSIALDPKFDGKKNNWIYLYYSPPLETPADDPATASINEGDAPETGTKADFDVFAGHLTLSRFRFKDGQVKLGTEQEILDVPVDRGICCHVGGDIVFDSKGNLIMSTGDDSNPFQSDGFVPLDERADRNPAFDAQRTAANTNDLRGKILRITPKAGGGYTIPKGNLFKPGTKKTRPEIYSMGWRNPFRIEIDPDTDALWVADYSPDAKKAKSSRGPAGHGKWAVVDEPGNYGWPYCATARLPYKDYNFATDKSGKKFDCAKPTNTSVHNTGKRKLPPVTQPEVWYTYGKSNRFPGLGKGGIGPMAGPAYQYDAKVARGKNSVAWPERYDNTPLFYEWTRDYIKGFHVDGTKVGIEAIVPGIVTDNPIDMEFGPDGALYVLEYGDGYFAENPDAQLSRIDFVGKRGNRSPIPKIEAEPTAGRSPLTVSFSSDGTKDPDGDKKLRYAWDFDGDGKVDSRQASGSFTYTTDGSYRASLRVTDKGGRSASADVDVIVGNQAPELEFVTPVADQTFRFGDTVAYEVKVTDDDPVDCSRVTVTYVLGHDTHGHPQSTATGCKGSLVTTVPGGHDPATDDLAAVFVAEYTDTGSQPGLSGSAEVVLQPAG
ncbi:glucose/arabinose dehydrogenase/PKD repeat protein [Nocardioides cavernae]|uniref:Glucose/arabinose dehydrogenase/PKD repeat protein n=1 Tax=Nocardioides cavernae TaxID=1921566 RepID=A0A7Y9KRM2_9ACTN|nr:PQQ-dependent sugar dehydrogenase [Nocardioides cavernae]NYE36730.1 glucose/arabinose dehydrogenase/PKD repeat protein [Nocardioides cavernae]